MFSISHASRVRVINKWTPLTIFQDPKRSNPPTIARKRKSQYWRPWRCELTCLTTYMSREDEWETMPNYLRLRKTAGTMVFVCSSARRGCCTKHDPQTLLGCRASWFFAWFGNPNMLVWRWIGYLLYLGIANCLLDRIGSRPYIFACRKDDSNSDLAALRNAKLARRRHLIELFSHDLLCVWSVTVLSFSIKSWAQRNVVRHWRKKHSRPNVLVFAALVNTRGMCTRELSFMFLKQE